MPGFVIHLAVANEYIRKHPNEIKQEDSFLKGVIAPDFTDDKSKTHYAKDSINTNLRLYLESNTINSDYDKGFFLHLITDCVFYQKYFKNLTTSLYDDYDMLNKTIIEKYNVKVLKEIEEYAKYKQGEPQILKKDIIYKFIEEVSSFDIKDIRNKVKKNKKF